MKQLFATILMVLCTIAVANAQKTIPVEGTILHKKEKQPIAGVEVKVNGQTVTTTDEAGHFALDVPTTSRKLVFSHKEMTSTTAYAQSKRAMEIKMRPAEPTFVPFISAGVCADCFFIDADATFGFGYGVGLGVTCNISKTFAITPSVEYCQTEILIEDHNGMEFDHQPTYLQVPVMFEFGAQLKNAKAVIGIGPYAAFHLDAKNSELRNYGSGSVESGYPFDGSAEFTRKSFEAGGRLVFKLQWRHFMCNLHWQYGLTDAFDKDIQLSPDIITNGNSMQIGLSIGYRF